MPWLRLEWDSRPSAASFSAHACALAWASARTGSAGRPWVVRSRFISARASAAVLPAAGGWVVVGRTVVAGRAVVTVGRAVVAVVAGRTVVGVVGVADCAAVGAVVGGRAGGAVL